MSKINNLVDEIDKLLPQTQCQQCLYPRCYDYANAISLGEAKINQCPPGGEVTINALAKLLNTKAIALNENHGKTEPKYIAYVNEENCIGCMLCIKSCPVDCIIGSKKKMHTVYATDCTGCKLCVPVCPTDCITLEKASIPTENFSLWPQFNQEEVDKARINTQQKIQRKIIKSKTQQSRKLKNSTQSERKAAIQASLTRLNKRKN